MYYNPKSIITIIKDELELSYYEINDYINKAEVKLKEKDIKSFLKEKYLEKHLNKTSKKKINKDGFKSNEDFVNDFMLGLELTKYKYEPYTLEYFKKSIDIYKKKCSNLIKIIDGIIEQTIPNEILVDLDIKLNKDGYILKSDIIRLVNPFVYNFNKLTEFVEKANDLNAYMEHKLSLEYLYRNDISEKEIYPYEELQIKHNHEFLLNKNGYIPLTEKQKKLIRKKDEEEFNKQLDNILPIIERL